MKNGRKEETEFSPVLKHENLKCIKKWAKAKKIHFESRRMI